HLLAALFIFSGLIWTALDAWTGAPRQSVPSAWNRHALGLAGLIFVQILLGALVAGTDAGFVYNDWPLMNGALFPTDYAGPTLWATVAHSQAAVQLHHRLLAYLLVILALVAAVAAQRSRFLPAGAKVLALALGGAVLVQAALGIATLMAGTPLWLALLHQVTAAVLLAIATAFAWRVRRP
ncbi:MAG: COX15/CtaA family protein, partial [Pseudomonadota bacterium]